jgi:hypothetical protein
MKTISLPMLDSMASGRSPVIDLLELYYTRGTEPDLRLALWTSPVIWASQRYLPVGPAPIRFARSSKDSVNDLSITLPDVGKTIATLLLTADMGGTPVVVRSITQDCYQTRNDCVVKYRGVITALNNSGLTISVTAQAAAVNASGQHRCPKRIYQPDCNNILGDSACGVDLEKYTYRGIATSKSSQQVVYDDGFSEVTAGKQWIPSSLVFESGILVAQSRPVAFVREGRIELRKPFAATPSVGDRFRLVRECLRTVEACLAFDNWPNNGGFYTVPEQPRNLRREVG